MLGWQEEGGAASWDEASLEMIRKWAASAESLIHGRASGLDAAVCTYGLSHAPFFQSSYVRAYAWRM